MTRINTNVASLIAQNNLTRSNKELDVSLQRLSTGLRINRGADDPAGLIVSERLRSQIAGTDQAITNIERASNVIATTEAALQEINTLLNEMKGLVIEAANTGAFSEEEIRANQLQIDSAVESITRISNTTSFADLKLLNGSLDYVTSGIVASQMTDVSIFSANFGTNNSVPVTVEVLNSAETARVYLSGNGTSALGSSVTFEVAGPDGVQVFTFASATALSAVVFAVNNTSDSTGVTALASGTGMFLVSDDYGSDAFISVSTLENGDDFATYDNVGGTAVSRDTGEDVLALVNGAVALGDGLNVSMNTASLSVDIDLTVGAAQTAGTTYRFDITGGGALYQLGPQVNSQQQVSFGIQSVAASHLGNSTLGFLSSIVSGGSNSLVTGQAASAGSILDEAIDQVSQMRGRLGSIERNTLDATMRASQIALENLTASESTIRDTDFAQETAAMTRAQILQQAGTSTLGIANSSAQSVLSLLG